jgi:phage pi2 protein 07
MITVSVDKTEVLRIARERISELVKEVDAEYVFWDSAELKRRTCMSWDTIQATFFFDPRFPKHKIGGKWYFPARETRAFLEQWLREQGT